MYKLSKICAVVVIGLALGFTSIVPTTSAANNLGDKLSGRILLQVEDNGEAWYVNPLDEKRYYMGRPADAFHLMRSFGLGITNADLNKLPIGLISMSGQDSDNDGLTDMFENSQGTHINLVDTDGDSYSDSEEIFHGYSPLNPAPEKIYYNPADAERLAGRILLQVESHGEAWYVNPVDNKRYYLGRPADAFEIMRHFGLGITNADLNTITVGTKDFSPNVGPEVPSVPGVTYATYSKPLYSLQLPEHWSTNYSVPHYFTRSYFAAHPEFYVLAADPDKSIALNVETLHVDEQQRLEERVEIMRDRYNMNLYSKGIVLDEAVTVNGFDGWTIGARESTSDGPIITYTTVIEVKPGYFAAVRAGIVDDGNVQRFSEDLEVYNTVVSSFTIHYGAWSDYDGYRDAAHQTVPTNYNSHLATKSSYHFFTQRYDVSHRLSLDVPYTWNAAKYDIRNEDQDIEDMVDELRASSTPADLELYAASLNMTASEFDTALRAVKDSQFTDVVSLNETVNFAADITVLRTELNSAQSMKFTTDMEIAAIATMLGAVDSPYVTLEKTDSENSSVDGTYAIQETYTLLFELENYYEAKYNIVITRVTQSDNVVYSFIMINEGDYLDSAVNDYNTILDSVAFAK